MNNYNFWTIEEERLLEKYCGTMPYREMVKFFKNRTPKGLRKKSNKMGLTSCYRPKKHSHDEDYWKTLDLERAYYAGAIATDGNLSISSKCLTWSVSSKDKGMLENFSKLVNFTGSVNTYEKLKSTKNGYQSVSTLSIASCPEWYQDLSRIWNITPQKTFTLQPPNVEDEKLKWGFIIGCVDGDGWITVRKNQKGIKTGIAIGLCGASLPLLEWVCKMINSKFPFSSYQTSNKQTKECKVVKSNHGNYYNLLAGGIRALVVFDFLSKFDVPKLARKWQNPEVLELLTKYKAKYPQFFQD